MVDFKELLVLIYLNDFKDVYLLSEIKQLCSFTTTQLKACLDSLLEKKMIYNDGRWLLTLQGKKLLKDKGLLNASIEDLLQDKVTLKFIENPLSFNDLYIPKNFKL